MFYRILLVSLTCIPLFPAHAINKPYGFDCQSMVKPLKKVLVRKPNQDFGTADYQKWHYTAQINVEKAQQEHDDFVAVLIAQGAEVVYHNEPCNELSDAVFVYDPALITNQGAIILRMGKELRKGEEDAMERTLNALGIPTLYKLHGSATAEAGDTLWLDENTLCIGRSFRTNDEGIRQIKHAVQGLNVEVVTVELPYDQGKEACLHLMSLISLIDHKIALVYKKLLPVSFVQYLQTKGFELIDVPENEYQTMGANILTIAPKVCLASEGNDATKQKLEQLGCTVYTYKGDEISLKAEGGATCLTRPLLRH